MKHIEFTFSGFHTLPLFAQGWIPNDSMRGIVGVVHGIGEHSGRYEEFAKFMVKNHFGVIAFDQRGHGKSPGKRGHTPNYDAWMKDISGFLDTIKNRYPKYKYFLYGHSLGGNQVLNFISKENILIHGVIASSPFLRLTNKLPTWKMFLLNLLNQIYPLFTLNIPIRAHDLSIDPSIGASYRNDPLVHRKMSVRLFYCAYKAGISAVIDAEPQSMPILIMHGSEDNVTLAEASREFASKAGKNCRFKFWQGFRHELHNEVDKQAVYAYVIDWLNSHVKQPKNHQ